MVGEALGWRLVCVGDRGCSQNLGTAAFFFLSFFSFLFFSSGGKRKRPYKNLSIYCSLLAKAELNEEYTNYS